MMEKPLEQLLIALESIGEQHDEIYDSAVREQMGIAIMDGFVRASKGFLLPSDFGMYSDEANEKVRTALDCYIRNAKKRAADSGCATFHERLQQFQNPNVRVGVSKLDYHDFFGHTPPEFYDANGNVIRTQ